MRKLTMVNPQLGPSSGEIPGPVGMFWPGIGWGGGMGG